MAKAHGKTISVFLMDGEIDGKVKVTISGWDGLVYRIPRNMLEKCKDYEAFSYCGIYLLLDVDDKKIYVGQADVRASGGALFKRISEHCYDRLKDDWDEVVILTRKDNSFGKTDISFLENYFYLKATEAQRYKVLNNNTPSPGTVTDEKECELEEYSDTAELVLGILGYKVFKTESNSRRNAVSKKTFTSGQLIESKKGKTTIFKSEDGEKGYILYTSKMYPDGANKRYWFGYRPIRYDLIQDCSEQFSVFSCGDEDQKIVFPRQFLDDMLDKLNFSVKDGIVSHYHIYLTFEPGGKITMLLSRLEKAEIDVSEYAHLWQE